jgi:4-hydroxythreonine-4-phosphate dehydrogenase
MNGPQRLAPIAISLGCPSGIGPEVAVVAASRLASEGLLLVGDASVVTRAAELRGVDPSRFVRVMDPREAGRLSLRRVGVYQPTEPLAARSVRHGSPSKEGGAAELAWIDAACDLAATGLARGMVTGPVSKDAIVRSKARGSAGFVGHTEHLAERLGAREVVMAFWSERFTAALVTTHMALRDVPGALSRAKVASAVFWLADFLAKAPPRKRGGRVPRIGVAGLNPHAGENGLFGDEEALVLTPGLALARRWLRAHGIPCDVDGPVPAETLFRLAGERFEGAVALYHDQATIPMKILGFGEAVNVSLGLPIVRTSVDHGTAYDLAGQGRADARGMVAAVKLAARLATASSSRRSGRPARRGRSRTRSA